MAQTTGVLLGGKPIVEVAVSDVILAPLGLTPTPAPSPISLRQYRALLDTGADITCLCENVIRECKLKQFGFIPMTGGRGQFNHRSFYINLGIWCNAPHEFEDIVESTKTLYYLEEPLEAAEIKENSWFDIIIGMNVLSKSDFHLKKGGEFTLTLG